MRANLIMMASSAHRNASYHILYAGLDDEAAAGAPAKPRMPNHKNHKTRHNVQTAMNSTVEYVKQTRYKVVEVARRFQIKLSVWLII